MLLINSTKLLSPTAAIFEPHLHHMKDRPFILHTDIVRGGAGIFNLHQNPELLYIASGKADIRYGDGVLHAEPGSLITVNAHVPHQVIDMGGLVYHCLIPDVSLFHECGIRVQELVFTPQVQDERAKTLFEAVLQESRASVPFANAGLRIAILNLVLYMCRTHAAPRKEPTIAETDTFKRIYSAINYIKENLARPMSVDALAERARISKYHFLRQFKAITGTTPIAYIHYLRCEYAKQLLCEGSHTVAEVAALCGFEGSSYFARIFKRATSLSPREYQHLAQNS